MKELENLMQTHPAYADNTAQANYMYRSYIGGELYKKGNYLRQYLGESSAPGDQYGQRLDSVPLDNSVATVIDIYRSFLFRELPHRNLGLLANNPLVTQWLLDTDLEGQGMDSFLKSVNDLALCLGNIWICVDKPVYAVTTAAEEIEFDIRAYASMYTPQNVLDWTYHRAINGKLSLNFIKVIESDGPQSSTISCWYKDTISRYTVGKDEYGEAQDIIEAEEFTNPLGYIPFVNHCPIKSPVHGIGYSSLQDIANSQKLVYNLLSELEQTIRISGHPSLAKTAATEAVGGAGAIITIPEDLPGELFPRLLQPTGASIKGIIEAIDNQVAAMNRMSHTTAIQVSTRQPISGTALTVERELLNAKLNDLSDTLKETETQLWKIWADWQNLELPSDFQIQYATTFDITDEGTKIELLRKAIEVNDDPEFVDYVKAQIKDMIQG